jgi:D-methionine transport system permease protein
VGTGAGNTAIIFTLSLAASFAISRIVEQNLLTVQPGVVEAARAAGAGPFRIIGSIVLPEALGPLILGYTFIFVALVDMSAVAGYVGGGGLGAFALLYGYRQFDPVVTWAAVLLIIVLVQLVQFLGNWLARRALRRALNAEFDARLRRTHCLRAASSCSPSKEAPAGMSTG